MSCKVVLKRNKIFFRIYFNGKQIEQLYRENNWRNRHYANEKAEIITCEIREGKFDYNETFPKGNRFSRAKVKAELAAKAAPAKPLTVREYYESWIKTKQPPLVRKAQARDYAQHFRCYVLPFMGNRL